jgi:hypothetical protein
MALFRKGGFWLALAGALSAAAAWAASRQENRQLVQDISDRFIVDYVPGATVPIPQLATQSHSSYGPDIFVPYGLKKTQLRKLLKFVYDNDLGILVDQDRGRIRQIPTLDRLVDATQRLAPMFVLSGKDIALKNPDSGFDPIPVYTLDGRPIEEIVGQAIKDSKARAAEYQELFLNGRLKRNGVWLLMM